MIAVGPMLDPVMEAVAPIDVTVLYSATVRPFDSDGLRAAMTGTEIVMVEPYLEGTSAAEISTALSDRAHRSLHIGVPHSEHRKYGSPGQHDAANGLDATGLRSQIGEWLGADAARDLVAS